MIELNERVQLFPSECDNCGDLSQHIYNLHLPYAHTTVHLCKKCLRELHKTLNDDATKQVD